MKIIMPRGHKMVDRSNSWVTSLINRGRRGREAPRNVMAGKTGGVVFIQELKGHATSLGQVT